MQRGAISTLVGSVAFLSATASAHAVRNWVAGHARILDWLSIHGFVAVPKPYAFVEVSEPSLFLITDGIVIYLLHVLALAGAVMAIALSLLALYRRENSLYAGCGLALAYLALAMFNLPIAVAAAFASAVGGTWLRRGGDV